MEKRERRRRRGGGEEARRKKEGNGDGRRKKVGESLREEIMREGQEDVEAEVKGRGGGGLTWLRAGEGEE